MPFVTLDHRNPNPIRFDSDDPPIDNLFALDFYRAGIFRIEGEIRQMEQTLPERYFLLSSAWDYPADLACQFDWFAVTVCNYLRLVGLIGLMQAKGWRQINLADPANKAEIRRACKAYFKEANPDIAAWRNKVSAHAAITDPYTEDNIATLVHSLATVPTWNQGRVSIGQEQWLIGNDVSQLLGWSITYEFDRLAPRFWPERAPAVPVD